MRPHINMDIAGVDDFLRFVCARPPKDRPDPGKQFACRKWFCDVVVRPDIEPADLIGFVALGGEPYLVRYNSKLPVVVYAPEGVEARYRLALCLAANGQQTAAEKEYKSILNDARLAPAHFRKSQKPWLDAVRKELG